jgi:colanic acid biosynthesis protein WcaH
MSTKKLPEDLYQTIVSHVPIVAVDFLVYDSNGRYLLGRRRNRPARGFWFVPGGRIYKGETLNRAIKRIFEVEVGVIPNNDFTYEFVGIYEHFYNDSFWSDNISTHYISFAFRVPLKSIPSDFPTEQFYQFAWMTRNELLAHPEVHPRCKEFWLKVGILIS